MIFCMSRKITSKSRPSDNKRIVRSAWREVRKRISKQMNKLRRKHKLTHRELAGMCGRITQVSIRWCSGAGCPQTSDLLHICRKLRVDPNYFYGV